MSNHARYGADNVLRCNFCGSPHLYGKPQGEFKYCCDEREYLHEWSQANLKAWRAEDERETTVQFDVIKERA